MPPQKMDQSYYPSSKKPNRLPWLSRVITYTILILLIVIVLLFRQKIVDQVNVAYYTPPSNVQNLVDELKLTDSGLYYFEASRPQVNSSEDFNRNCQRKEANSIILGCYSDMRIFIYDVKSDSRLKGVMSVTAAHELMHAAWDRLSPVDRSRVTTWLYVAYNNLKTPELEQRMEYYNRQQPGDDVQELHSIIGTEFKDVGEELENYYKRYFNDRPLIVKNYNEYSKLFADITAQEKILKAEIDLLAEKITNDTISYNNEVAGINQEAALLNSKRASIDVYDYVAVATYNNERNALVARIDALNLFKNTIEENQKTYEEKVAIFNELVVTGNGLTTSLDSTLNIVTECRLFTTACDESN